MHRGQIRGNRHKLKEETVRLGMRRNFFPEDSQAVNHVTHRHCAVSSFRGVSKPVTSTTQVNLL